MNFRELLRDDDAVSPVIGVILMVAITVILAAVIGTFVLGLGDQVSQSQPSANIGFNYSGTLGTGSADYVGITHKGGDKLDASDLEIVFGSTTALSSGGVNAGNGVVMLPNQNNWRDNSITAGDQVVVTDNGTTSVIANGVTVRVIWSADSGDTAIIAEGTVQ